jgi:hypothetical protein
MNTDDASPDKVNLNLADEDELAGLGLEKAEARALIEKRPFGAWGDLKRIEGFDQARINAIKSAGADLGVAAEGPLNEPGSGGSELPAGEIGRA